MSHPTCDKLNEHTEEWNAIFPFIEWLHENRMCIGVWRDPDAPYINTYTEEEGTIGENAKWLLEHPYPWGSSIEALLYKYFDVDPGKLENERRQILANLHSLFSGLKMRTCPRCGYEFKWDPETAKRFSERVYGAPRRDRAFQ